MATRERMMLRRRGGQRRGEGALTQLQRGAGRMFTDLLRSWFGDESLEAETMRLGYVPRVDVAERENEVDVTVELPGLGVDDIELYISEDGDLLMLRGEKREEHVERQQDYFYSERSFGSFRRTIPLPAPVDPEKCDAEFRDGVLRVTLEVQDAEHHRRRIPIREEGAEPQRALGEQSTGGDGGKRSKREREREQIRAGNGGKRREGREEREMGASTAQEAEPASPEEERHPVQ